MRYCRIAVMVLALTASACVQPPQYTESTSTVGVRAGSAFSDVTLAVVPTENTEKSRHYIAQMSADERKALQMLLFLGAGTAVEAASLVVQFVPLIAVGQTAPGALPVPAVDTLAYLPFEVALAAYDVSAAFFGCYGILLGLLVWQSGLMPRPIGALVALGALAYVTYSFGHILAPAWASQSVPWIQLPSLVGESSLALWLLARGVADDPRRFRAR